MTEPKGYANEIPIYCAFDTIIPREKAVPNPENPNHHPERQIRLLAKIIRAQGWRSPIVISKRSGFITKGHGRLLAAIELDVSEIPVDYQEYESEADEWADLQADNRLAELAIWDDEAAVAKMLEFEGEIDLELFGVPEDDLSDLISGDQETSSETGSETGSEETVKAPEEFLEYGDDISTDYCCPKCGYEWSGKAK